jgi:5' nucleotidase, deoxy (Pyrimidine), cytosolic type C protein (NT5C)
MGCLGMTRNGGGPVVALDLDGTLADYHSHFLWFAELWYGREFPDSEQINMGLPLHKFMGTSKAKYRQCKLAYRQGGIKRFMPIYPGAAKLSRELRNEGAQVWICTTRPYLHLSNIEPDTREWLRRNKVQYDGVLYGDHKYHDLVKQIEPSRIVMVLEDLPKLVTQALNLGLPVVVRSQPYNIFDENGEKLFQNILRVDDMEDALDIGRYNIQEWRENAGSL